MLQQQPRKIPKDPDEDIPLTLADLPQPVFSLIFLNLFETPPTELDIRNLLLVSRRLHLMTSQALGLGIFPVNQLREAVLRGRLEALRIRWATNQLATRDFFANLPEAVQSFARKIRVEMTARVLRPFEDVLRRDLALLTSLNPSADTDRQVGRHIPSPHKLEANVQDELARRGPAIGQRIHRLTQQIRHLRELDSEWTDPVLNRVFTLISRLKCRAFSSTSEPLQKDTPPGVFGGLYSVIRIDLPWEEACRLRYGLGRSPDYPPDVEILTESDTTTPSHVAISIEQEWANQLGLMVDEDPSEHDSEASDSDDASSADDDDDDVPISPAPSNELFSVTYSSPGHSRSQRMNKPGLIWVMALMGLGSMKRHVDLFLELLFILCGADYAHAVGRWLQPGSPI
ncbi:hypothetical protein PAPYR_8974 [Paratrimastix pyriformis]|uniref:F-box domain-containing protein n=1 Tax=Paratrimastix pyriformis TaxID=342808 RepID=A0ABQ8U9H6_9EUKA|nr:hypothetical protein PAPYR_8974 [Paratrimastix pyriformis]